MIRKMMIVGVVAIGTVGLAGCAGGGSQLAATATRALLPAETLEKIGGLCVAGEPLVQLGAAAPISEAKIVTSYVAGYCDQMLSGQVPSTTDANTVNWLNQNLGTLRALLGL